MSKYKIHNQDVLGWAKTYEGEKFHALLSDPPYHLQSIVKRFGKQDSAPAKYGDDGVFQRASSGFMGQECDGGDIAFNPETWHLLGKHLYDGAFGMVFSASRNWHRVAVAIEDAGFIIHPTIFCWIQGQGFPKATNIDKQIDKKAGKEQTNTGELLPGHSEGRTRTFGSEEETIYHKAKDSKAYKTIPATDLAKAWQGHRYGLQALKPSVEPIIVFQKPYDGKPLDNITQTGAGALNIDDARIPLQGEDEYVINTFDGGAKPWGDGAGHKYTSRKVENLARKNKGKESLTWGGTYGAGDNVAAQREEQGLPPLGRWPANFVVDDVTAQRLDEQSGTLKSGLMKAGTHKQSTNYGVYNQYSPMDTAEDTYADRGGASRFFWNTSYNLEQSDPIFYCPKVSPKEKKAGLEERCNHPTLKPIDLNKWLATLLLPPDMYSSRRLLVPFSGVGSEVIGALLAGWDMVVGIEMDTEQGYIEMAEKRIEHFCYGKGRENSPQPRLFEDMK